MDTLRPASLRSAAALVDGAGADSLAFPVVFEAVVAGLHLTLGPWIGPDGCTTLLHRAMLLAARMHPALRGVTLREATPHLDGLERLGKAPPGVARTAVEAFLALALQDLGALVGDGIALRIVLPDSPHLWSEPATGSGDSQ